MQSVRRSLALILLLGACSDEEPIEAAAAPAPSNAVGGVALQWLEAAADASMPWSDADAYCRGLQSGGMADWRLPEIDELASLYEEARAAPCGDGPPCRIASIVDLRSPYVWSATAPMDQPSRRYYFDYRFGSKLAPRVRPTLVRAVLCVRERSA